MKYKGFHRMICILLSAALVFTSLAGCEKKGTLSFLNSFKVFREAYLVAGNYPHESIYMTQHLFNNWFQSFSLDKLSAAAVMEGGVLLFVILLLQKVWRMD